MYTEKDVCAAIVTYNCDELIDKNIVSLLNQVGKIVIIDNNSNRESIKVLEKYNQNKKIQIIFNNTNNGLAYGLNQVYRIAMQSGFRLLLTMDQDSELLPSAVKEMLNVINNHDITSVGPVLLEREEYKIEKQLKTDYQEVQYLITSGNLTVIDVIKEIGGYAEELFIDSIDFDFSLRLKERGYRLAIANKADMIHEIGEKYIKNFLFFKLKLSNHSPLRYYYIYRNNHYIIMKYFRKFPVFCIKKFIFSILHLGELLFHTSRREKYVMVCKGVFDAIKGKYGNYVKLR